MHEMAEAAGMTKEVRAKIASEKLSESVFDSVSSVSKNVSPE